MSMIKNAIDALETTHDIYRTCVELLSVFIEKNKSRLNGNTIANLLSARDSFNEYFDRNELSIEDIPGAMRNLLIFLTNIEKAISDIDKKASTAVSGGLDEIEKYVGMSIYKTRRLIEEFSPKDILENQESKLQNLKKVTNSIESKIEKLNDIIKKSSDEIQALSTTTDNHKLTIEKLSEFNEVRLNELEEIYKRRISDLDIQQKKVNETVGLIAGAAIMGKYEKNALAEREVANSLRRYAIGIMSGVIILMAYSFHQITTTDFDLKENVLRTILALFLSIPAAYLARESAKHRKQEYTHLQTALDLAAFSPYIESLPAETQHKLKEEMASRIFTARNFDYVTKESYPLNMQELIIAIMDKIPNREQQEEKNPSKT
ncbi:hypothetical protein FHI69_02990 [Janthinobacterium lividum]|uniref:Uncharacterized protein n=1 Tax=Janthinobacterium lividum TaxID=29581 RepID=A0A5C4P050_9BURK|nr:hypothetical protein [Janthinobacterium lividum]TNC78277.1 hypothetical protein FHI69_02990 [Janthinobacterium lividum]